MHRPVCLSLAALTALGFALTAQTGPAEARCTRLAFSVNDYGKEGPARDARNLLDKYIQKWTGEHGIKKYTTGKKDVSCELFLDFGFFDEYTCKASALVCWEGTAGPRIEQAEKGGSKAAPKEPVKRRADGPAPDGTPRKAKGDAVPKSAAAPKASPVATGSLPAPPSAKKE